MVIRILHTPYAVDVYRGDEYMGGITRGRMESREAPYMVAEALQCILAGLGLHATVAEDTPAAKAVAEAKP